MMDDVLKLREALYAAEPFLTYLLKEGETPRNNEPLRKALSMVREALDMPPPQKPVTLPDHMTGGSIVLTHMKENEDGSADVSFEVDQTAAKLILQIGMTRLLEVAAGLHEKNK